jgi:hypothetical protein
VFLKKNFSQFFLKKRQSPDWKESFIEKNGFSEGKFPSVFLRKNGIVQIGEGLITRSFGSYQ